MPSVPIRESRIDSLSDGGIKFTARTLFRGLSHLYDRVLEYATLFQDRYWKTWLLEEAKLKEGSTVLDLGSGTCVLEQYLGTKGCRTVGLDLTEEMVRIGSKKRLPAVESLIIGDAENLPFGDCIFDVVLSCYIAKYCRPENLVSEVKRSLKPGGKLVLYDFSHPRGLFGLFHAFYLHGVMKIAGAMLRRVSPGLHYTFTNLPSIISTRRWEEAIESSLVENGFSQIRKRRLSGGVVTGFSATFTLN